MSYIIPSEFVTKMVDAGESKIFMSTRDTLIRGFMAGAILALAAVFAVAVTVQTGSPLVGAMLFPVGFVMLYLMGFDLLTGVFTLVPLALLDAPWAKGKKIIVLEPRRIAARASAERMAKTLRERPGETVGYRVRFGSKVSRATRTGAMTRTLLMSK